MAGEAKTSESHPIEVFWVDQPAHGTPGRLGLTFTPGKRGSSIRSAFTAGENVVIHCRGGRGRTGTIAAIVLTTFGHSVDDAIAVTRLAQPSAVETWSQQEYVGVAAQRLAERSARTDPDEEGKNSPTSQGALRQRVTPGATDRSHGALLGLAVGDALGTTVEFKRPGSFEPLTGIVGGGPFSLEPGEWTDDTSMALCLAESLVEKRGFDPLDQSERYLRWYRDGHFSVKGYCFDIGNTTAQALTQFERSREPFSGPTSTKAAGNGSIMRLAPVPMAFARDPAQAVRLAGESSPTTHGARACIDACRYMAGLIVGAISGVSKDDLLAPSYTPAPSAWETDPLCEEVAAVANGSFLLKQPPAIRGSGYVVESLEAALWAFANSDSFAEGALKAVNLGDDADTTGAVYGQIAGAYYGVSGIPSEWLELLAMREEIERRADELTKLAG